MNRMQITGYNDEEVAKCYSHPPLSSAKKLQREREKLEEEKRKIAAEWRRLQELEDALKAAASGPPSGSTTGRQIVMDE